MMRKKKVWTAGCAVCLFLLICTVLSLRIEKMMRIEVEVAKTIMLPKEEGMEQQVLIPLSCYKEDENGATALFYVEEREGLFGTEWVVVKEDAYPMMEERNMAVVFESSIRDDQNKPRKIVNYCTWPLEDGDVVVIAGEEQ